MNILIVHEISYLRDPVWEMHQIAELLSLRGHYVYAIDYGATSYQEMDIARVYPDTPNAKVHLIRPPSFGVGRIGYSFYIYTIYIKVLREKKIDIIVLYSAPTNGIQTILAAHRLKIPIIFRSIDALHKLVPKMLSLPTKLAERLVYRRTDKILTITPALSRYVVSLGAACDRVGIQPLGIDLRYPVEAPNRLSDYQTMVFAGTLPSFSGIPELLKQMPGMVARMPNLRLLIVGDGVQRPELERMIEKLGLEERVKITGMVPHEDVPKWIAGADIGVLTFSTDGATRDIFPTKVLQYMAQGKPVVANPLPGLVDFGLGWLNGVVYVKNGDWLTAITTAWENRNILGSLARKYVEREHGYDRIVSRLEGELESLCRLR